MTKYHVEHIVNKIKKKNALNIVITTCTIFITKKILSVLINERSNPQWNHTNIAPSKNRHKHINVSKDVFNAFKVYSYITHIRSLLGA